MIIRTHLAAAAPVWVRDRLAGPRRTVPVIHSGADALYVAVDVGSDRRCVGLLSSRSSAVPCGLQTVLPNLFDLDGADSLPPPGDTVEIGEGTLHLGTVDVAVGRIVDPSVPSIEPDAAPAMGSAVHEILENRLDRVIAELSAESLELLAGADPRAVPMMLGRGSGLTPLGDDVLSGWLATLHAAGAGEATVLQAVADTAQSATTLLSATLLDRAGAGQVLPEFKRFFLDLRSPRTRFQALVDDVDLMLSIGHTSGAGMLLGSLLALEHLTT